MTTRSYLLLLLLLAGTVLGLPQCQLQLLSEVMTTRFYYYLLLILAGAVVGFVYYDRLDKPYRLLTVLMAYTFISELSTRILGYTFKNSNPPYHILIPFTLILQSLIYISLLKPKGVFLYGMIGLCAATVVFSIINSMVSEPFFTFPSRAATVLNFVMVAYTLMLYFRMLQDPSPEPLYRQPVFWFNTANLVFYGIVFFILGFFSSFKSAAGRLPEWMYDMLYVCNMIMYACYLATLLLKTRSAKR